MDKAPIDTKAGAPGLGRVETLDIEKASFVDDNSSIVPGSIDVTHDELKTLRHVSDSLPLAAWLVVFVEFAERWSYYGTTNVLNNVSVPGLILLYYRADQSPVYSRASATGFDRWFSAVRGSCRRHCWCPRQGPAEVFCHPSVPS
jgi:hypothetical protein